MEYVTRTVPANFNLFPFGDVHIGTLLHSQSAFDNFIQIIHDPYHDVKHNIVVGMGDYIEAIDHSDKRFDVHSIDLGKIRPDQQIEHFIKKIEPIKKKIVVFLDGNHEYKLLKYFPYVSSMSKKLGVPYGTYTSVITFQRPHDKGHMFRMFATHGNGTISSIADSPRRVETNLHLSLERKLKHMFGDCAIMAMGHTHKLLVAKPRKQLYLSLEEGKEEQHYTESLQAASYIHPDHRYYLNTGSFVRLYRKGVSGYAERAMYDPMEMGLPCVRVRERKIVGADKIYL